MNLISKFFGYSSPKKGGVLSKEWSYQADSIITTVAAVSQDGSLIVIGTQNGKIIGLDYKGKVVWKSEIDKDISQDKLLFLDTEKVKQISADPIIGDIDKDGKEEVVVASDSGMMLVLDHKGNKKWSFSTEDAIRSKPLIADINDDKKFEIIVGSSDTNLYVVNYMGNLIWKYNAKSSIESTPCFIDKDEGQIIFGTQDGTIYSLNKKGKKIWQFNTESPVTSQPTVHFIDDNNFEIFIGSHDKCLYSLDMNGQLKWKYQTDGRIYSKAIVADTQNNNKPKILIGSCDDKLHVLTINGNKLWDYETDFWVVAPPLVYDLNEDKKNEILIGSYDHHVYVLDSESEYNLDYVPGISAITQQSGHYFDSLTKLSGKYHAKLLDKFKTESMVTGIIPHGKNNNGIIVSTKSKKLDKFKYNYNTR